MLLNVMFTLNYSDKKYIILDSFRFQSFEGHCNYLMHVRNPGLGDQQGVQLLKKMVIMHMLASDLLFRCSSASLLCIMTSTNNTKCTEGVLTRIKTTGGVRNKNSLA